MIKEIVIKKAGADDSTVLQSIGKETFFETFAEFNTPENMQAYLENNFTQEKIGREIANPDSLFFIAWENGEAIGYLKLNKGKAQTELQDENAIEIERIYVRKDYHGKKVGQLLYAKALEVAAEQNKLSIWLGVWENNHRAIAFYEKNGFEVFDRHIFRMGDEEQTDFMMRKVL